MAKYPHSRAVIRRLRNSRSRRREGVLPKCRSATGPRSQRLERGRTRSVLANFHTLTRCERGPFALRLRFSRLGNTPVSRFAIAAVLFFRRFGKQCGGHPRAQAALQLTTNYRQLRQLLRRMETLSRIILFDNCPDPTRLKRLSPKVLGTM